jgi:CelD/BcsL family acetyltransferase involved in cellulose biosynthesis
MTDDGDESAGAGLQVASEALEALAPEWAALHRAASSATPFNHPAWFAVWLRHFGADTAPVFLAVRYDEALIGVIPLDADATAVRLLGDPDVCDYASPLVADDRERDIAEALLDWLDADLTSEIVLWGQRAADPFRTAILELSPLNGWAATEEHEAVSPAMDLPSTWDGYLAGLGKHDRHELRRKLRRLEAAGAVAYERLAEPSAVAPRFDAFLAMMRTSREDKDQFLTLVRETFFRDLAVTYADLGLMRLGVLSLDGAAIAMLFTFEHAGVLSLYNSGYDPAQVSLSPGLLSKALALRDAIDRGLKTYDFLRGDEDYKRHLGGAPRPVLTITLRR